MPKEQPPSRIELETHITELRHAASVAAEIILEASMPERVTEQERLELDRHAFLVAQVHDRAEALRKLWYRGCK